MAPQRVFFSELSRPYESFADIFVSLRKLVEFYCNLENPALKKEACVEEGVPISPSTGIQ